MKFRKGKFSSALVLFSLCAVAPGRVYAAKCGTGEITESRGETLRELPLQAKVEHLKSGQCVFDGMALMTHKNSDLGFALVSGPSTIQVAAESELLIGFPIGGKPTKLSITRGEIRVKSNSVDAPVLNFLRMTVTSKTPGTVILGEVFHDGQEAWVVVTKGSALARLGDEGQGVVVAAGNSIYITEGQKDLPRVVGLDDREMEVLSQDHGFKKNISQLMMVESGAENKPDRTIDEGEDLTLEQYAQQERDKKQPLAPAPPVTVTNLQSAPLQKPQQAQTSISGTKTSYSSKVDVHVQVDEVTERKTSIQPLQIVQPEKPLAAPAQPKVLASPTTEDAHVISGAPSVGIEFGPTFYGDSTGYNVGAKYLAPMSHVFHSLNDYNGGDQWSVGAGVGYDHASKDSLSVSNWKFVGLVNYRTELSSSLSLIPEFSLGAAIENVGRPSKTYVSGAAIYIAPDLLVEMNIERSPHFHPGVAVIAQDYAGSASLFSMAVQLSLRFDF